MLTFSKALRYALISNSGYHRQQNKVHDIVLLKIKNSQNKMSCYFIKRDCYEGRQDNLVGDIQDSRKERRKIDA